MPDFILVTGTTDGHGRISGKIFNKILRKFKNPGFKYDVKKVALFNDSSVYIVKIPHYVLTETNKNKRKIENIVSRICVENNVRRYIFPESMHYERKLGKHSGIIFDKQWLYRSLLIDILNKIYSNRGIKVYKLDIAIIRGEKDEELISFVRMLSSFSKYITILTEDKGLIEGVCEEILGDSGLSVGLTFDHRNGLRNRDIIINLDNSNELLLSSITSKNSIIINYGNIDVSRVKCENILINGVDIKLPPDIRKFFDRDVYNYYSMNEIAIELLGNGILELISNNMQLYSTYALMELTAEKFREDGFMIDGFNGRHGIIKNHDLVIKCFCNTS